MKRLLSALLIVILLAALAPTAVYASPLVENGTEGNNVGRVIGALGLYAAMMAVLAVGSEVVIDAVRPIFGLKRKVTASQALKDLKEWLPGTLEDLDISPQAQQQLNEQIEEMEELTTQFEDRAEKVREAVRDQLPDTLKDLAIHSVDETLDKHWDQLEPRLKEIDPDLDSDVVREWLEATLVRLKETNVAEMAVHLDSVSTLLDSVREQNYRLQGPLRKFWRWLQESSLRLSHRIGESGLPSWAQKFLVALCRLPSYPAYVLAWLRNKLPKGDTLEERLDSLTRHKRFDPVLTMEEAAKRIFEEDTQYKDQEKSRIAWIRILSAIVGLALSAMLQVDSLRLLEPIMGNAADIFRPPHEAGQTVEWYTFEAMIEQRRDADVDPRLGLPGVLGRASATLLGLTPGIVLSGLGAAAGSGFWHDQLDKLRSAKAAVAQVESLMGQGEGG